MAVSRTAAALVLAAALWPREALARSPCEPGKLGGPHFAVGAPGSGAADVPIDTLLWGFWQPWDNLVLRGQNGEEIALLENDSVPFSLTLRPERLLTPETDYTLWNCPEGDCRDQLLEFRTGSTTAATAAHPTLLSQRTRQDSGNPWVDLTFEFAGVLAIADASHEWIGTSRSGSVIAMQDDSTDMLRLYVGDECDGQRTGSWPYDTERVELRFGTYNLAGEFSGWSEPQWVEVGSTACSVGARCSPGLLVILILVPRRRRPRR